MEYVVGRLTRSSKCWGIILLYFSMDIRRDVEQTRVRVTRLIDRKATGLKPPQKSYRRRVRRRSVLVHLSRRYKIKSVEICSRIID